MGLSKNSTGINSVDFGLTIEKKHPSDVVVALAGNPNVGKSTLFNALTGMNQHTGNWPGKTVASAQGVCHAHGKDLIFVDIPGCYSLLAHSPEEEIARDFVCFGGADVTVVVCDATCVERNLNLVYQTIEAVKNVVVCINLIDEAEKKGIAVDCKRLENLLCVPVIPICARSKEGLDTLLEIIANGKRNDEFLCPLTYPQEIETAVEILLPLCKTFCEDRQINPRWLALRLLTSGKRLLENVKEPDDNLIAAVTQAKGMLKKSGLSKTVCEDLIVTEIVHKSEQTAAQAVSYRNKKYNEKDRKIDRILTSRAFGFPLMFLMLAFVFWLTITGSNYPSELLSTALFRLEDLLYGFCLWIHLPVLLCNLLIHGVFRVLAWVVSVMLPPMAIFFPLFTLLEDSGVLPRIAFNLDRCFKKCSACGKQSLTMCMGFGCNAAGVVGCRIIDSPRERLIAILTNVFVPCNGRFPAIISIIAMFFVAASLSGGSILSALILSGFIVLGILLTLFVSKVLSMTVLKGLPSSFVLEMPPYRRPQIGKVIVRSILDRTLFVLGRAVAVAAPAGLIIWLAANIQIGGNSLLTLCSDFLDPFGRLLGLDGEILLAFILGFPANEIVIPIVIMCYMNNSLLTDLTDLAALKTLLVDNGWTLTTAVSFILFSLCHWPCSTTLITVKKETGSIKWTLAAFLIPTAVGILLCMLFNGIVSLI